MTNISQIMGMFRSSDLDGLQTLLSDDSEALDGRPPFAGGGWLHYAARYSNPKFVSFLLSYGFDVNEQAMKHQDRPIVGASRGGHIETVKLLIDNGSKLDTKPSEINPLVSGIIGGSREIVQLLLDAGIDAEPRHKSGAVASVLVALVYGHEDIARMISDHIAGGDKDESDAFFTEASLVALKEGPLRSVPIVSTEP